MNGVRAFREQMFTSDSQGNSPDFGSWDARLARYEILWSFMENTAYRNIHNWATKYKADYGLYKYTRNIYNPANRLIDFWQTHIMGGALDTEAGDGKESPSALPIITDNDSLRTAIAKLWLQSNWQINKDMVAFYGALFGDVFIQASDDVQRQKVCLEVIHPGLVKSVTLDGTGNVKAYTIEEQRPDPDDASGQRMATYTEIVGRGEGLEVSFQTLKNNVPYAWNKVAAEWSEPYGFVPLVKIQHANMGLDWGWSELHPELSKIREVDDMASKLNDQIRKTVEAPMLITGVKKPDATPTTTGSTAKQSAPEPGREEIPTLYGPPGAEVHFMVAPLQIADTLATIKAILEEIERDYPELKFDIWNAGSDASGRALRTARQPTEVKVQKRRASYDSGLVKAHQMAVAIGGLRGYDGYQGFGLDSFQAGTLDFSFGKRPVFAADPLDDLELSKAFWDAANQAKATGGMPALVKFLRDHDWDEKDIAAIQSDPGNAPFQGYPQ